MFHRAYVQRTVFYEGGLLSVAFSSCDISLELMVYSSRGPVFEPPVVRVDFFTIEFVVPGQLVAFRNECTVCERFALGLDYLQLDFTAA